MPQARFLTFNDRAYRREKVVAEHRRGAKPRELANKFGLSLWYVRDVVRLASRRRLHSSSRETRV